jgi:hypothetical protein
MPAMPAMHGHAGPCRATATLPVAGLAREPLTGG